MYPDGKQTPRGLVNEAGVAAASVPGPAGVFFAPVAAATPRGPQNPAPPSAALAPVPGDGSAAVRLTRHADPPRTAVRDAAGNWVATFTDRAYTVTLAGPRRVFSERSAAHPVVSTTWVRVLPEPFSGVVDRGWLARAREDESPDVLAVALQYIEGAPVIRDARGRKIAGDAAYGPEGDGGALREGSDFNDYLGIGWAFDGKRRPPRRDRLASLDCSGFVRMVFGYRGGLPLARRGVDGKALPRRSYELLASAPGVVTIPNRGVQIRDFSRLAPGDLVFFDADPGDGARIDHVGIYLGVDAGGRHRFVSSRKGINGPTLGDYRGASLLDGAGLYARAFRASRRL